MSGLFLFLTSFLATGVEMVEALTIILAVGVTRGWRSTFMGAGVAAVALAVIIFIFGATLADRIPLPVLRVVVGTLLLIFGLQWLRKGILRSGGLMAYHDEARIFDREVRSLQAVGPAGAAGTAVASQPVPAVEMVEVVGLKIDWTSFVLSFKGVLLEGLEAAFIVITFGMAAPQAELFGFRGVGLAGLAAFVALAVVAVAGLLAHKPLSTVPENTLKLAVGLVLISFGTFWGGEGLGVEWPLADVTLLILLGFYCLVSWLLVAWVRQGQRSKQAEAVR